MNYKVSHIRHQKMKKISNLILRPLFGGGPIENFSVFHTRLLKDSQAPHVRHNHTDEFVYCLKGSLHAILDKKRYILKEGHIIWIPRGTWHMFKTHSDEAEALAIFSPPMNLEKNPDVEVPSNSLKKDPEILNVIN